MSSTGGSIEQYRISTGATLWSIRYRVPDPAGGSSQQKRERGFRTRKDATAALRKRLSEIDSGGFVAPVGTTFGDYTSGWLERQSLRLRPSTLRIYRTHLQNHILPTLGAVPVQRIDSARLDTLYAALRRDGRYDGHPLSPASVRLTHSIVSGILSDAHRRGVIVSNPATNATPPGRTPRRGDLLSGWNRETLRLLLDGTRDDEHGVLWRVAAMTGARRGELLALTWDRVDLDGGRLTIDRTLLDAKGGTPAFGPTKSGNGTRVIDLDEETAEALRRHRTAQARARLLLGAAWLDHGLVFGRPDGGAQQGDRVSKSWRSATDRLHLPPITFHSVRHLHATLMLEAGVPVHVVSRRLGHGSPGFTMSVYAHALPQQDRAAVETLAALV